MAGSTYGKLFKISTWGESHGKALGVVIDGCPAGLELSEADIQPFMDRRKPGQSKITTQRNESDKVEILSGVYDGITTGTPISIVVFNKDQNSNAYDDLKDIYRPGHADYTFATKYGHRDHRGGGRSSGRETLARVAAGAIASKILGKIGISVTAYTKSIGDVYATSFDASEINKNIVCMPDAAAAEKAVELIDKKRTVCESVGGTIECIVKNTPVGIGETVFDKLDANLAKAIMSIGAVKAVEIGDGIKVGESVGSYNNDSFVNENGLIKKATNHSGGILGGMSDGSDIIIRAAIKPTPSIAQDQQTVDNNGKNAFINIKGRHDPVIVPRAVVVVESMVAITLLDMIMENMSAKLDNIIDFYK